MRLLSLDFDGVLHPTGPLQSQVGPFCWLDEFAPLVQPYPDVHVLVHSTWRYEYTDAEIQEMLGALAERFVGCTPRGQRYESIRWVISQNKSIRSHLILDDEGKDFPTPAPEELVLCDPQKGVSEARVRAAVQAWLARG